MTISSRFGFGPKAERASALAIRAFLLMAGVFALRHYPVHRAIRPQAPAVTVQYYDVEGATASEIWASIRAHGPRDQNDGHKMSARTSWHIGWSWPNDAAGACNLSLVTLDFRATILLPHLLHPEQLSPDLRTAWQRFEAALRRHEDGHVRHAFDNMQDVGGALRSSTCADANAAGLGAIRTLNKFDITYDATTRHGATQGVIFPRD